MISYLQSLIQSSPREANALTPIEMSYNSLFDKTQSFAKEVIKKSELSSNDLSTFEDLQLEFTQLCANTHENSKILMQKSILIEKVFTLIFDRFHKKNEEKNSQAACETTEKPKQASTKKRKKSKTSPGTKAKKSIEAPIKTDDLEGIINHGNNCCFIATYQLLKQVDGFFDSLPETLNAWKNFSGNDRDLRKSIQKIPGCTLNTKKDRVQEDASEILQNLLNQIEYPFPLQMNNHITYDVSQLFDFMQDANKHSSVNETFCMVPISMQAEKSFTFQKALNNFFNDLDPVKINVGGIDIKSTNNIRRIKNAAPNELLLSFNRFRKKTVGFSKNNSLIKEIPLELSLNNSFFETSKDNTKKYRLKSAVIHHGSQMDSGHYTTLTIKDNQWLICDDDEIKPVDIAHAKKLLEHAYILHYTSN